MAAARITTPQQRANRMPRFLVYSRNKKGKTRFCATAPNVIILDPEAGTDYEKKINPNTWHVSDWDGVQEFYDFMKNYGKSPKGEPYLWVGLDGLTKIHNMALTWVRGRATEASLTRKPEQVTTPDYGKANELVKGLLHNFHNLTNIGLIITSQERMIEMEADDTEDTEEEAGSYLFIPDLPKGTRAAVNAVVDVIGHLYIVKVQRGEREVQERRLWLAPSTKYDTGFRSEYNLPDMLRVPTVPRLTSLIRTGNATEPKPTTEPTPTRKPVLEGSNNG